MDFFIIDLIIDLIKLNIYFLLYFFERLSKGCQSKGEPLMN